MRSDTSLRNSRSERVSPSRRTLRTQILNSSHDGTSMVQDAFQYVDALLKSPCILSTPTGCEAVTDYFERMHEPIRKPNTARIHILRRPPNGLCNRLGQDRKSTRLNSSHVSISY